MTKPRCRNNREQQSLFRRPQPQAEWLGLPEQTQNSVTQFVAQLLDALRKRDVDPKVVAEENDDD